MSFLDALAGHIATGGFGIAGTSIVVGAPPDDDISPDEMVGLVDRQGLVMETFTAEYGRPNLTVVVRGPREDSKVAEDKAWAIWRYLNTISNSTIGGVEIQRMKPSGTPGFLRVDAKRRTDYTMEYEVWLG